MKYRNTIKQGNALEVAQKLPENILDMIVTSPPYFNLRDYGTKPIIWDEDPECDHKWEYYTHKGQTGGTKSKKVNVKGKAGFQSFDDNDFAFCTHCNAWKGSLGLEPNIDLYVKHLCDIFEALRRPLKSEGSLWVNIGDSYHKKTGSLLMIPSEFAREMIKRGFILRNIIVWHKFNAMPSSVKNRFTIDFEYVFFFVQQKKYFFEQQFEPLSPNTDVSVNAPQKFEGYGSATYSGFTYRADEHPEGRNKRSVWSINTAPNPLKHFASYPVALLETPILASCPQHICKNCGKPRKKIYDESVSFESGSGKAGNKPEGKWNKTQQTESGTYDIRMGPVKSRTLSGYTNCGCNSGLVSGIVGDPFIGVGTTALAARQLGRDYLGIELNPEYIEMAEVNFSQKGNLQSMYGRNIKKLFRKRNKK